VTKSQGKKAASQISRIKFVFRIKTKAKKLWKKKNSMIIPGTVVEIIDNSGGKKARCLKILSHKGTVGTVGDTILVSIQKTLSKEKKKMKTGDLSKALITEIKAPLRRQDGTGYRRQKNSVVLLTDKNLPQGSRFKGVVSYELREKNFVKVLSLAPAVI